MKYPIILFDIDETLLDFNRSKREAFSRVVPRYGAPGDSAALDAYSEIDKQYWEMLERGEITKPQLLKRRFEDFFALYGLTPDCEAVSHDYLDSISGFTFLMPGAIELCRDLHARGHRLVAITNSTFRALHGRLVSSGLEPLFERIFISDEIGAQKPDIKFFNAVFAALGNADKNQMIVVGDSLTSDMRGGRNAGLATCWFNPGGLPANADCDYVIERLGELVNIVK